MKETAQFLGNIVGNIERYLPCEAGSLLFVDPAEHCLVFRGVFGEYAAQLVGHEIDLESGICGWVARHGKAALVPDVREDERFEPSVDRLTGYTTRSVLCVPVKIRRRTVAVIELINPPKGRFDEDDLKLLQGQARRLAKFLEVLQLPAIYRAADGE